MWKDKSIDAGALTAEAFGDIPRCCRSDCRCNWIDILCNINNFRLERTTGRNVSNTCSRIRRCLIYYRVVFIAVIFVGAIATLDAVWLFADVMNGLMAIPNLIGLLGLSGVIVFETKRFNAKLKEEEREAAKRGNLQFHLTVRENNEMISPKLYRKVDRTMDLSNPTPENVSYMIEKITEKLRMVNVDAMKAENFSTSKYEDLHYMYKMVMKRATITPNEMQAIAAELGTLRS